MNYIVIAGHLGADPETRFTSSGKKVTTLRVATHTRRNNADDTIWWRVTVWGDQYDKMISYLKKGSPVIVFGDLQKPEIFTDRDGKPQISMNVTATHLQFSPFGKPERAGAPGAGEGQMESGQSAPFGGAGSAPFAGGGSPFASQGVQMGRAPAQAGGTTYDDEVPF